MSQLKAVMIPQPRIIPIKGEMTKNTITGIQPLTRIELHPALAIAAPAYPLMIACDELVGRAMSQVMMSQTIAPMSPPQTT